MKSNKFVPLHCHSNFSFLDGITKIEEIAQYCVDYDVPACAITDHGVLTAAPEQYEIFKEKGIKPIFGTELYVSDAHSSIRDNSNRSHSHLVVLAKNLTGWKTLLKII